MPAIASSDIRAAFVRCSETIERHQTYLTRLDAVLGDGDHGDNLALGFRAVCESIGEGGPATLPGPLIRSAGYTLAASAGGASGPLYGTALIQAGLAAGSDETLDGAAVGRMLDAAATALAARGRCDVGDKTIYDALRPAADAFHESFQHGQPTEACLAAAVHAAWLGMLTTRRLVARRGLALRLGPRSIGHLDPGAVSCVLLLRALVPGRRSGDPEPQDSAVGARRR
ncbi:MAG: phosphoenolpyruvate---glycerone phosphotransferase subunit DhaL [Chloroflexota bacterium]|nr:phosphoenolpyruvate---glycerone phosphotransferase subunit DhaL [Chloroflexota bacterium]